MVQFHLVAETCTESFKNLYFVELKLTPLAPRFEITVAAGIVARGHLKLTPLFRMLLLVL